MEIDIKNRIRDIYKIECGSIKSFSEKLGIPENTLKNVISRGIPPNYEILKAIAKTFPKYSMDWLITGQGDPIRINSNRDKYEKDYNNELYNIILQYYNDIMKILSKTIMEKDKEIRYLNAELIKAKNEIIEVLRSSDLK